MITTDTETEIITSAEAKSLRTLESKIKRGLGVFFEVGEALATIRNEKLYRANSPISDLIRLSKVMAHGGVYETTIEGFLITVTKV